MARQDLHDAPRAFPPHPLLPLLEHLADGCYLLDDAWAVQWLNQRAEQLLGLPRAALLGATLWATLPTLASSAFHRAHLQAAAERRSLAVELVLPTHLAPIEAQLYPSDNGLLVMLRTQPKHTSDLVTRLPEVPSFEEITAQASDVFWRIDPLTRQVLYGSPSFEQIWGLPLRDLYERADYWRELIVQADRERVEQVFLSFLAGGSYDVEYRIRRPDGAERWIRDRAFPLLRIDGQIQPVVGVAEDVTVRKQAELERGELLRREQAARQTAEQATERMAQLQVIGASLGRALSPARVAEIVIEQGSTLFGAVAGSVVMVADDGETLELVPASGYAAGVIDTWQSVSIHDNTPLADAIRLRRLVWVGSMAARAERYPELYARYPNAGEHALAAVPLVIGERAIGAIGMLFEAERRFDTDDYSYLLALAQQAAQAIERTRLYQETAQALMAIEEALAQRDMVLDSAPIGVALWDTELRYVQINQSLAALNGRPPAEHIGRTLSEVAPRLALLVQPLLTQVLATSRPLLNIELRGSHPTSTSRPGDYLLNVYPVLLPNGQMIGIGAIVIDITERKRIETTRGQLGEITAALAKTLTVDDVLDVIVAGLSSLAGMSSLQIARYDTEALDMLRTVAVASVQPNESAALLRALSDAVHGHHNIWRDTSGMPDHGPLAALPLLVNNQVIGVIGIGFATSHSLDVYDREFVSAIAQQCAQAIERARLYEAERQARAEAEAAVRTRDQFLSIAAHELKTPLTTLFGNAQLLERRLAGEAAISARDAHTLQVIIAQSRRLNQMIMALLDVSRIQSGQLSIERAPCDLAELVQRVVGETQPGVTQHPLVWHAPGTPLIVAGDALRLEQVLHNLLQNAVKYSPHGGQIVVAAGKDADTAWISISDQGIGIPADAITHLFERFYRATNADPQRISGLGIGLYVVREIVRLHGGEITIHSVEGAGSTFTVLLPLAA